MSEKTAEPRSCPACGDRPRFYAKKDGYAFWRSPECGLLFVWPYLERPPQEIYQSDYFGGAGAGFGYVDYDSEKDALAGFFEGFLRRAERQLPGKGALLDVGSATGHFVGLAQAQGWAAQGIDVSAHGVAMGKAKGLRVEQATLEDFQAPAGSFDMLTMWDVIEHLPDPFSALEKCRALLRAGGLLAINTPDAGSLWARLWGKRWHSLVPPEHIFMFNRAALKRALEDRGFDVIEMRNPIKSFTMPYILSTFSRWSGLRIPSGLTAFFRKRFFASFPLPVPLRDNLLVVARKR